eukprot:5075634-Amphidinium_carterae.1
MAAPPQAAPAAEAAASASGATETLETQLLFNRQPKLSLGKGPRPQREEHMQFHPKNCCGPAQCGLKF